ncbi:MAG: DUF2079 domain-containing protein [Polyangiales bacterium]
MSSATRWVVLWMSAAFSGLLGVQSLARFGTYHNRTYDLAMYARQAWGLANGELWDPIVGVHFLGTHLAFVLWPLGWLGRSVGIVPVLLIAQALAIGLTTWPLAQLGARRFGDVGALCAATAWFAYPNISQVATYEFHPGTLAVFPLALALDAMDRQRFGVFALAALGVLACRADFACLTCALGFAALCGSGVRPGLRRTGTALVAVSSLYLALQYGLLRPRYWAGTTSYDLHFARWGGSPLGIVRALLNEPGLVREHLSEPKRLLYFATITWPLAFLPLLGPRFLLPALPLLAINVISTFPTTLELYSHYLTPAVPALIAAALEGLAWMRQVARERAPAVLALGEVALLALGVLANLRSGAYPWSQGFDSAAYVHDTRSAQAARIVAAIHPDASVQAPDPLLPHLAARANVYRLPPPDRAADFVVLDVSHRLRYDRREDLLRTLEEPQVRTWLTRRDYGLVLAEADYMVFERGREPRGGPASRYLSGEPAGSFGTPLTRCLSVLSAWFDPQGLELELAVHAPCPPDLALRIDIAGGPSRVDLLFDGLLSPALLHEERAFSWHPLSERERQAISEYGLTLGVVRSSGSPPEYGDPVGAPIAVIH